jgi:hypothetical protein
MDELVLGILSVIAETLLEILGEAVIALFARAVGEVFAKSRAVNPFLAALGYFLLGSLTGVVSVFLIPHPLVHRSKVHGLSMLVSPLVTGLVMSQVGVAIRRRGKQAAQIESFGYGFAFALGMALIRFLCVKPL